jgi:hypothetical protein
VAQHLPDLVQRCAVLEHLCRHAVAEPVGPRRRDVGPAARSTDDRCDVGRGDTSSRRPHVAEEASGRRFAPPLLQIGGDRLPDVDRQRERVEAAALSMDEDLAGPPVDVGHLQADDLDAPQPETDEDREHGEVTRPDEGGPVAARQERLGLARPEHAWQRARPGRGEPRHCLGERGVDELVQIEVAEERPQTDDELVDGARAVGADAVPHRRRDGRRLHRLQRVEVAAEVLEERSCDVEVVPRRDRCERAHRDEPHPVVGEDLAGRRRRLEARRQGVPRPQVPHHPPVDPRRGAVASEEVRHRLAREAGTLERLLAEVAAQAVEERELPGHARLREAEAPQLTRQTFRLAGERTADADRLDLLHLCLPLLETGEGSVLRRRELCDCTDPRC